MRGRSLEALLDPSQPVGPEAQGCTKACGHYEPPKGPSLQKGAGGDPGENVTVRVKASTVALE
jgi:hypothetical protein